MHHKFLTWLILVFCLFFILIFSCKSQDGGYCTEKNKRSEILIFDYPSKIRINYMLDEKFIDESEFLGFEKWGSDKMKRYIKGQDTLTISWTDNLSQINDTFPIYWLREKLKTDLIYSCNHSIFSVNLNELKGAVCEVECKNNSQMTFFGHNSFSEKLIVAKYTTKQNISTFRDDFVCVLNSMIFR